MKTDPHPVTLQVLTVDPQRFKSMKIPREFEQRIRTAIGGVFRKLQFRPQMLRLAMSESWPVWLAASGVVISSLLGALWTRYAFLFGVATGDPLEAATRTTGMVLQLLGILTVAIGLHNVREVFGRPSMRKRLGSWIRLVLSAFGRPTIVSASSVLSGDISFGGRLTVDHEPVSAASLEERIELLEKSLREFRTETNVRIFEINRTVAETKADAVLRFEDLRRDNRAISSTLEEYATGGLHLEGVGLVWLSMGVVATSIPSELAVWLAAITTLLGIRS